jgi:hypothetical protein
MFPHQIDYLVPVLWILHPIDIVEDYPLTAAAIISDQIAEW